MDRSVVITGLGATTAFGVGVEPLWEGLLAGRSRLKRITRFDPSGFPCRLGGEAPDLSPRDFVPKSYRKAVKVMARDIQLAVASAKCAVEDAGLSTKGCPIEAGAEATYPAGRVGCHIGAGLIAAEVEELSGALATAVDESGEFSLRKWGDAASGGMGNLQPLWLLKYLPNMLACHVTIIHDARGPSNAITCAEASGLLCAGESMRVIQRNDADACFSGAAAGMVTPMGLLRMDLAGRLAPTRDEADGSRVLRPFDPQAPGQLLGEGGAIVILEEESKADERGAKVYARLSGFGAGHAPRSDDPKARSRGLAGAIRSALADAELAPGAIDAIVPHASGVAPMDAEEAEGLRAVFGDRLAAVPLVTLTPNVGDMMAGHGAVALCAAAMCVRHQALPARLNSGAPAAGLDAGPAEARDAAIEHILVCANALGGQNAAVVLSAC